MENYIDYLVEKAFSDGYNFFQKEYTRQDKKALEELNKATNGFTTIPKGRRGMTPRDTFRLHDLAHGFNKAWQTGDTSKINMNDAKTFLGHIGLPETAKGAEHLIHKYTDPKLRERYNRLQSYKKAHHDAENGVYKKIAGSTGEKVETSLRQKLHPIKDFIYGRKKSEELNSLEDSQTKKQINALKRISSDPEKNNFYGYSIDDNYRDVRKKLEDKTKRSGLILNKSSKNDGNESIDFTAHTINIGEKSSPGKLAHELGHAKHYQRLNRLNTGTNGVRSMDVMESNFKGGIFDDFQKENGASANGLAMLKKQGMSKKNLDAARNELEDAYRTYWNSGMRDIEDQLHERYKKR